MVTFPLLSESNRPEFAKKVKQCCLELQKQVLPNDPEQYALWTQVERLKRIKNQQEAAIQEFQSFLVKWQPIITTLIEQNMSLMHQPVTESIKETRNVVSIQVTNEQDDIFSAPWPETEDQAMKVREILLGASNKTHIKIQDSLPSTESSTPTDGNSMMDGNESEDFAMDTLENQPVADEDDSVLKEAMNSASAKSPEVGLGAHVEFGDW